MSEKVQQNKQFEKKCEIHEGQDIIYIQTGDQKQKQIGVCVECITANGLQGQNLMTLNSILNDMKNENSISQSYPHFKGNDILKKYSASYNSLGYLDPSKQIEEYNEIFANSLQFIKNALKQKQDTHFVDKIGLINSYNKVAQKGEFLTNFNDYMSDTNDKEFSHELSSFNKNIILTIHVLRLLIITV
ncbi:hypothetical protein TTHERM_01141650 (macronuclear) [Tetrahymena thermophila SB210]|uniref:Uncharacterized protein n=1 Tax=Tetrahymena thermophila (strain SB210) TaxID=312017 RepID=Q22AY4_TETTS|nr:hypothetical protein TTHERM_01141650 [Tetrahymena thermophila SB210]EAR82474.2 hypothetical protein TTHERM_01141650 [Tetrahymena thermophila SB210]|eukprot:XP_001030137.2 hypothetical protein TTHERM_01141650 [Tetrahymena thermophila SB210]